LTFFRCLSFEVQRNIGAMGYGEGGREREIGLGEKDGRKKRLLMVEI